MKKGTVIIKQKKKKNGEIIYKRKFLDKIGLETKGITRLALEMNGVEIPPHWADMNGDDILDFFDEIRVQRLMSGETSILLYNEVEILNVTFGAMEETKGAIELKLSYEVTVQNYNNEGDVE